ncbi:MAG: biosynthetic arginine decarboxylase, partial [Muribaculaceae bacterium]|nr:biosynthetic arginine decarboxylase [Muribaculaceae bacterium]
VDVCVKNEIKQPNIITESGRSLSAHHSILIFEALESTSLPAWSDSEEIDPDSHELARELYDIWDKLDMQNIYEAWHDALQIRDEALELFSIGLLDLRTRAQVEKLFWSVAREVAELGNSMKHPPEELRKISRMIPDKYFCNFSLFQSLPDHWAVDQIFPIMPISRLDEKPTRFATIQDMTCDSDGKIAHFVTSSGLADSLPVHALKSGEPYYIGVFLVGAYQEILGDLHNLFGDTNAVHIDVYPDHYEIDRIIDGETVAEVLDYVQFSPKALVRNVERWATAAMKAGKISPEEGREFLGNYRSGLYGYTYLEKD